MNFSGRVLTTGGTSAPSRIKEIFPGLFLAPQAKTEDQVKVITTGNLH